MDKLTELKAMADSLGMTVESTGTVDKEEFCVYKEGKEVMKGSSDDVKNKLEDFIMDKDLEGKIREMIEAGKSDDEILKAMDKEVVKAALSREDKEMLEKAKKIVSEVQRDLVNAQDGLPSTHAGTLGLTLMEAVDIIQLVIEGEM
jgi:transaldolase